MEMYDGCCHGKTADIERHWQREKRELWGEQIIWRNQVLSPCVKGGKSMWESTWHSSLCQVSMPSADVGSVMARSLVGGHLLDVWV